MPAATSRNLSKIPTDFYRFLVLLAGALQSMGDQALPSVTVVPGRAPLSCPSDESTATVCGNALTGLRDMFTSDKD
jgi:hypothetical protein